ncbi:MAG: hypothetical protein PHC88_13100 [Terrimicrobiaceae bacterium]|nr:hypothetical protein [Terrimicrobiaceae bacterium]
MNAKFLSAALLLAPLAAPAVAQVADTPPPPAPTQANPAAPRQANPSPAGGGQSSFLGKDVPFFDPDSETITWDGRTWNVSNSRVFQARFEKYLNAPEETDKQAGEYEAVIAKILDLLRPRNVNPQTLDQAFGLLPKASAYTRDSGLCDTISNQVYSAWQSQQDRDRMLAATNALETERNRLERNKAVTLESNSFSTRAASQPKKGGKGAPAGSVADRAESERLDAEIEPFDMRIVEVNALMKANQAKRELKEIQAKIEFQSLIVQLFLQRRFEHVLIATRFYRNVFNDGDDQVRVKGNAKDLFDKTTGMPPTVGTLDSMANEIMRDVAEGVDAYDYLIERGELDSATKRLSESFLVGEYLPSIRTLPRETKRRSLAYAQKANQLVSAIEVKDYTLAGKLVTEMESMAKDFDSSKPMAAIQTAKTIAAMHLAKAKNSAVSGDRATLETELQAATEIWPRNPALQDVSSMIFAQSDVQNKALIDLDQLLGQKNYRQIYENAGRFAAAVATDPARQKQLSQVLDEMKVIETAITRAQEIEKRGDAAGAWESAEQAYQQFPDDRKLSQVRSDLTTKAADFVRALRRAQELEQRGQPGSSLAWFLKAQQEYPNSDFAKQGIERLSRQILPDAT